MRKATRSRAWTEADYRAAGQHQIKVRLPLDAIEKLAELAEEGGYSRAEVIDSLIRLAWAETPGRKLKTKADELAAFAARSKGPRETLAGRCPGKID